MSLAFIVTSCVTFTVWTVASLVSQAVGSATSMNASDWLASGVTFGAMMVARPGGRLAVALGAALAAAMHAMLDLHGQLHVQALLPALVFGLSEITGCGIGAAIACRLRVADADGLVAPGKAYAGLLLGALFAAVFGATMNQIIDSWALAADVDLPGNWWLWTSTSLVGILLVAPVALALADAAAPRPRAAHGAKLLAGAAGFLLFLLASSQLFLRDGPAQQYLNASVQPALIYLPLLLMVVTALFLSERGAALVTLTGALLLIGWSQTSEGPFSLIESYNGQMVSEVHAYVAVMALLVGIVSALVKAAQQSRLRADQWHARYLQSQQWSPLPSAAAGQLPAQRPARRAPGRQEPAELDHHSFRFGA